MSEYEPVTRSEFEDLRRRVDMMDQSGTRGVAVVSVQVQQLAKDVSQVEGKLEQHMKDHINNRRWYISTVILFITAVGGLYPLVYVMVHK